MPAALVDRVALLDRFARIRRRTDDMFGLVDEEAYYARPIPLRNPIVFYEGHLPAFAVNTLVKRALGRRGVDDHLETIFARGIDPEAEASAVARRNPSWPSRQVVREYAAAADRLVSDAIATVVDDGEGPLQGSAAAVWTILEHEEMHQETLAYIWHQLPYASKRKPAGYVTSSGSVARRAAEGSVRIPRGQATLGTNIRDQPFAWDNELPAHRVATDPFEIDTNNVTNAAFMCFVERGGYRDRRWWRPADWDWIEQERIQHPHFWEHDGGRWYWRGMFERIDLPESWPVYVTWAEASAYARWRGLRLPTEVEFHRAAFGTPGGVERRFPWGDEAGAVMPANADFVRWDPESVGVRPEGASAYGVNDLVGNGWEWTSTAFAPFEGFTPTSLYPEYSADFFDGDHFVLKGASAVTARELIRSGFRNWFRPRYPYVYASFRCARSL
jgi:ergothioneine biosynthesis protein EgtB